MSGAWAKGANKAVATAPPNGAFQTVGPASGRSSLSAASTVNSNNSNRHRPSGGGSTKHNNTSSSSRHPNNNNDGDSATGRGGGGRGGAGRGRGGGGGRGGRGRGGGGRNNIQSSNQDHRSSTGGGNRRSGHASTGGGNQNNEGRTERIIIKDAQLLKPAMGTTPAQKSVQRFTAKDFILLRTQYLEADPERFRPHEECHWTSDDRADVIQALCRKVMELGDVSKNTKHVPDTAPPLEECKPLEVNEETRWKSKAMVHQTSTVAEDVEEETPPESEEVVIGKALLILNKISWTTLERLTDKFVEQTNLQQNDSIRHACVGMLIKKAQTEQHFGPMYAQLCAIISKQFKPFKKDLLGQCQAEFELDTAHKIAKATEGITDLEEIEYHSTLIRKAYIGHIKFLGELYLRNVVKQTVMSYCLDELLKDETDEENLECFVHLMTTMGQKMDDRSTQNTELFDWDRVQKLRTSHKISSRIKFLLQDLLELKGRDWIERRQTDRAKSIADLHKEVANEEKEAKMNRRSSTASQSSLRRATSLATAAATTLDEEGFSQIRRGSMKKVGSKNFAPSLNSPGRPKPHELRRAVSQPVGMDYVMDSSSQRKDSLMKASAAPLQPLPLPEVVKVLSPDECAAKMTNLLKEYFVGGDTADAVVSIHEMVHVGMDGSIDRGTKAIEAGVLMVLEMKEVDVKKFLTLMESCINESKIENVAVVNGLNDPLEFLSDIEIDAPLARNHLVLIISEFMKWKAIDIDFLQSAPQYFRTDGKPAAFAIKVLKKRGGDPSDIELTVIESLMTEDDKKTHESPRAMFDALP